MFVNEDVSRGDALVDDVEFVNLPKCFGDGDAQRKSAHEWQRAAALRRDLIGDGSPKQLYHQGHIAVAVQFEGVRSNDGRYLVQPVQNLELAAEFGDLLSGRIFQLQSLDYDVEAVREPARPVDGSQVRSMDGLADFVSWNHDPRGPPA